VPIEDQTADPLGQEITDAYMARLPNAGGAAAGRPDVTKSGVGSGREIAFGLVSPSDEALRISELRNARATFEQLAVAGPLQADAHLLAGVIALKFTDRAAALQHFAAVERLSADQALLYDARMLSGVAHERRQEWNEAVASYLSALTVARGNIAAARLTALLLRRGRSAEAETFEEAFLTTPDKANVNEGEPFVDAWLYFGAFVASPFAGSFDQLRKAIR
jgi:tetratricopeptide (TPR) repeat protein